MTPNLLPWLTSTAQWYYSTTFFSNVCSTTINGTTLILNTYLDSLPINKVTGTIQSTLNQRNELVIEAPPGAGKTTAVPLALLNAPWLGQQTIVMLEPRRMAARAAAERMAFLLGEKVGERVGYRIRQENKVGKDTRIIVITEGVLGRWLHNDPELTGVAAIIFDEFHERSLDSDTGFTLAIEARSLFRSEAPAPPLKLIAMSATLDGAGTAAFLNDAPLITSEGKRFPVEMIYDTHYRFGDSLNRPLSSLIRKAWLETSGNMLVFLPGRREIHQMESQLKTIGIAEQADIFPLHGGLSLQAQNTVIAPIEQRETQGQPRRRIILSTDIAETSITIEGITTVVDSGLRRVSKFDSRTGTARLETIRISKASSTQRAGRAGRVQAGSCYRLWSREQQQQLIEYSAPEIEHADLAGLVLQLLSWGIADVNELRWLTPPPKPPYSQASDLLRRLGISTTATSGQDTLSPHGEQVSEIPAHPRIAHMLIEGCARGLAPLACTVAALLAERDPFASLGVDLTQRIAIVDQKKPPQLGPNAPWLSRVSKQRNAFLSGLKNLNIAKKPALEGQDSQLGFLLACAFPDRVGRKQDTRSHLSHHYKLSNGRLCRVKQDDGINTCDWIVVADLGGQSTQSEDTVFLAAPFHQELFDTCLSHLVLEEEHIDWDEQKGRFLAEQRQKVGRLTISTKPQTKLDATKKVDALVDLLTRKQLTLLPWDDDTRQWQARVELMRSIAPTQWPDLSDSGLLDNTHEWLRPYLNDIKTMSDFKKLPLMSMLQSLLSWDQQRDLDRLAPQKFEVPTGSKIALDYSECPPRLAVKLQEMFGLITTPTIANGEIKLMIHLLSPARRPLQITQDLEHFWRTSYHDVKKEMKGRYPKHPWPDDPLAFTPTKYTKHKRQK